MTKIPNIRSLRGEKMDGGLGDKPHLWALLRSYLIACFIIIALAWPARSITEESLQLVVQRQEVPSLLQVSESLVVEQKESEPVVSNDNQKTEAQPEQMAQEKGRVKDKLHSIIEQVASRHNVDPALIKAIIMAESGYDPRAVSKKGAKGLMQLMPKTAQELGVTEVFDPEDNVEAGVRYFKRLLKRFGGDVKLALAAYNAGSTKVRRYRGVPPIRATRYYVRKVFHYYRIYKKEMNTPTNDA